MNRSRRKLWLAAMAVLVPSYVYADAPAQEPAAFTDFSSPALLAAAAPARNQWSFVTSEGDVLATETGNTGPLHFRAAFTAVTADYFRGVFNGVQEELNDWSFRPDLSLSYELVQGGAMFSDLTLTVGFANGLSDRKPFDDVSNPTIWYRADYFAGLSARMGDQWLVGLTYTLFQSPNDAPIFTGQREELALALRYVGADAIGDFQPQIKVAAPIDANDGFYVEGKINPGFNLGDNPNNPLRLSVPVTVGAGFDSYYGDRRRVFGDIGVDLSMGLGFMDGWGSWTLATGVHLIWREQGLVGGPFDDTDDTVVYGFIGIGMTY